MLRTCMPTWLIMRELNQTFGGKEEEPEGAGSETSLEDLKNGA